MREERNCNVALAEMSAKIEARSERRRSRTEKKGECGCCRYQGGAAKVAVIKRVMQVLEKVFDNFDVVKKDKAISTQTV